MAEDDKKFSKQLIGKTVVSKTGKRFGELGDIVFETRSGELVHIVLHNPTSYTEKLELEKDKEGNILIPFSAVIAVGDFLVIVLVFHHADISFQDGAVGIGLMVGFLAVVSDFNEEIGCVAVFRFAMFVQFLFDGKDSIALHIHSGFKPPEIC